MGIKFVDLQDKFLFKILVAVQKKMPADCLVLAGMILACENIRFYSLSAAGDVSQGGTSAT